MMRSTVGGRLTMLVCALALVVVSVPALAAGQARTAGASKATALPSAPSLEGPLKVKPTSMQIVAVSSSPGTLKLPTIIGGKQSGNHSGPLKWKKWNQTEAVTDAYIYEGTKPGYASTVTLTHPKSVDGHLVFTQLKSKGGSGLTAKLSHRGGPEGNELQWAPPGS